MSPSNRARAEWARHALQTFIEDTGSDYPQDAVSDLLCDLMHLCKRDGISFRAELDRGERHYAAEIRQRCACHGWTVDGGMYRFEHPDTAPEPVLIDADDNVHASNVQVRAFNNESSEALTVGMRVRFTPQGFAGTVRAFKDGDVYVTWDDGLHNDTPIAPLHLAPLQSEGTNADQA